MLSTLVVNAKLSQNPTFWAVESKSTGGYNLFKMDNTPKMLQAILNGQSAIKQELLNRIDKVEKKLSDRIDGVDQNVEGLSQKIDKVDRKLTKRIDNLGKQLAYSIN